MKILLEIHKNKRVYYECLCPYCNRKKIIRKDCFNIRKRKDCGCLNKSGDASNKYKSEYFKLYKVHEQMKQRCFNKNCKTFYRYGGRGITVCDEWLKYSNFKEWALNNGYKEGLDIDRIDNNGDYEPNNCRFVTHIDNCYNRNTNLKININGKDYTTRELSNIYNLPITCIQSRYEKGDRGNDIIRPYKQRKSFKNSNTY